MQLYVKPIRGTSCSFSAVSLHFLSLSPVARDLTNEIWSSNSGSLTTCIEINLFSHDAVAWGGLPFETYPVPSLRPPAWLITHWDVGSDVVLGFRAWPGVLTSGGSNTMKVNIIQ
jgi:hypothetical protein